MLGMRATPAEGVGKWGFAELLCGRFLGDCLVTSLAFLQARGVAGDVPRGRWKSGKCIQNSASFLGRRWS